MTIQHQISTPADVIRELRAMSAQFICPKDTYFARMVDVLAQQSSEVERLRQELAAAQALLETVNAWAWTGTHRSCQCPVCQFLQQAAAAGGGK